MPLAYYPSPGEIVICHYDLSPIAPEMSKIRPVVVGGPRLRRRSRLVTIVPLSTTEPIPCEKHHCRIELDSPLPAPFDSSIMRAKCDMISVVARDPLDRFKASRARYGGPRQWTTGRVSPDQLRAIRVALLCRLGFETLTNRL